MHPTWDIPELVEHIFNFLPPRDAAKAATVCRSFWSAALPRHWRNVDTFDRLTNLLPHDPLMGTPDFDCFGLEYFKRQPKESDWERFLLYSYHTKTLSTAIYEGMSGAYRGLVEGLPATPILPNLESIELDVYWMAKEESLDFLSLFLPRTVSEVRIQGKGHDSEATIGRVLQSLVNDVKVPNLKTLGITTWNATTTNLKMSISQVLRSYEGIQALKLELQSGHQILEVLFSAGQLNNLRHLDARTIFQDAPITLSSRVWLPELETLQLNGAYPFIVSLLTSVEPRSMREVKIVVEKAGLRGPYGGPTNAAFWSCLSSIGRFVHLKTLEVGVKFSVLLDTLRHILPCTDLETFRFVGPQLSSVEGGEDLVERMVEAWPRLKTLELRSTFDNRHGAQTLRLSHLQVIAKECQALERLCISIDARGRKSPMFQLGGIKVAKENVLRKLEISCVLLEDVSEMGLVMIVKQMWPWLHHVRSGRTRISGNVLVITLEFN
ncbi:hypothetical protein FRC01_000484 [Tulasnella sp. 417]|nr:hypothetical protein FRC01_000484 [Tulasnella sp. 417]